MTARFVGELVGLSSVGLGTLWLVLKRSLTLPWSQKCGNMTKLCSVSQSQGVLVGHGVGGFLALQYFAEYRKRAAERLRSFFCP